MIEVTVNDRLGKKVRVKCLGEDTVEDFKKVLSVQLGQTKIPSNATMQGASQHSSIQHKRLVLIKGQVTLKDHITLEDYEIHDGTNIELYYA
ncbi:ubiquitin-like modifier hub1 [Hanseniaspora vineae]